jgi:hypothetical protein
MHRITLFDDDHVLLLDPRWSDLGLVPQVLLLSLLCCVPLALVFWLYRYEMRLVAAGTARILLCLRAVAIILLLMLVVLQPVYARVSKDELPSRVIVAVDVSDSMHVADPQRDPIDKLKLARGLKIAGDLCSTKQLDDWIRQYADKKPTIQWLEPEEFVNEPEKRQREEALRRKAHDAVCSRVDALTRSQTIKQLLSRDGVRFLDQIKAKKEKVEIELIGFATDAQDVKLEAMDELFRKDQPNRDKPKPAEKDSDDKKDRENPITVSRTSGTDLGVPLAHALTRSGAKGGKIRGIVLLTDGQHNVADTQQLATQKAIDLKDQGIPLYPVAIGATKPPMDAAIVAMTAPPSIFKDVDAPIKVRIKATGLKAQDLKVIVHKPGEEAQPLDQKTIKHDGKDQEYFESFQVRLDKEGKQVVEVTVKPQAEDVKEINTANNKQSISINVADDTSKVLLVDGEARWEFHYLWQALLRDRSMKVKSVVFTQPRLGKVPESELAKMNNPSPVLPPAPKPEQDPLFDYDCIILGDVMPEQITPAERIRLEKYVADRGGTLVVLAGKRAMPLAFLPPADEKKPAAAADDKQDPLIKMLPITQAHAVAPEEGFPVTLTEEGKQTEFMKLEAEGSVEDNLKRWSTMLPHGWGIVGKAKPGATILAYVAGGKAALTPEEKKKREQESALMVRHNYGFGRVFFVGVDSTWRYRYRVGDTYHHRFWSQTIRWAASDKPLVTGNKFVRFGTPQALYRDDENVKLTVRLSEEIEKLPEKMQAQARILKKDADNKETAVSLVDLKPRPFQPRVLEAQFRQGEGEYFVEVMIPGLEDKLSGPIGPDGKATALRATFKVSPGENGEMVQLSTNFTLLKELADKNGTNKVYTPETASEIVELLTAKDTKSPPRDENISLWTWWPLLIAVLVLLTIEWVLRKWAGLP